MPGCREGSKGFKAVHAVPAINPQAALVAPAHKPRRACSWPHVERIGRPTLLRQRSNLAGRDGRAVRPGQSSQHLPGGAAGRGRWVAEHKLVQVCCALCVSLSLTLTGMYFALVVRSFQIQCRGLQPLCIIGRLMTAICLCSAPPPTAGPPPQPFLLRAAAAYTTRILSGALRRAALRRAVLLCAALCGPAIMQLAGVLHVLFTMPILPHHHPMHCRHLALHLSTNKPPPPNLCSVWPGSHPRRLFGLCRPSSGGQRRRHARCAGRPLRLPVRAHAPLSECC